MAVPSVTFPLEQKQVRPTYVMLLKHLHGLQVDAHLTQELLKVLSTFCSHPNKKEYNCPDCGLSWGD